MLLSKYKKKVDKFVCKSLSRLYDKPLAVLTDRQKELVEELRTTFREFSVKDSADCCLSERVWSDSVNRLREQVLHDDPREFLRWHVVSAMMFAKYSSYAVSELKYLKKHPEWESRWSKAIEENSAGHPIPYGLYPKSSANLIHHAYHLAVFEDTTKTRLNDLSLVFEFGGGYGSMCRLFQNLGFKGRYVIFDLPQISALQRFFLNSMEAQVCSFDSFKTAAGGILCVSDIEQLKVVLLNQTQMHDSLFLATWSISEVPVGVRDTILPLVSTFDEFLIAYQDQFQEVNNIEFFSKWSENHPNIQWRQWEIKHLPKNRYLFGLRKQIY